MRARLSPSHACGGMTGQVRRGPAHPERRGGTMRIRTVRLSPIVVGLAVLLTVAALAAVAAATSQVTNVSLEAYGLDAGGEPRVRVYSSGIFDVGSFLAYTPGFTGGVRVAIGDIDGD